MGFKTQKRTLPGKGEFVDWIETGPSFKISPTSPLTYTYGVAKGSLYLGAPLLWAKRELMAASKSGQKAGALPAKPNDLAYAKKVAMAHYKKYKPQLSWRRAC